MRTSILRVVLVVFLMTTISIIYTTTSGVTFAQTNNTSIINKEELKEQKNNNTVEYYVKFHTNMQEIISHIEKAEYDKNNNNDTLAFAHTRHPLDEVLPLITIPLNKIDSKLNTTYFIDLNKLSNLAVPGNSNKDEFDKQVQRSINLSNKVISTVIPAVVLKDINHNTTVIQNLLSNSIEEYSEGVQNEKVISTVEYQDGSAFINRAFNMFNNTKSITNNRDVIFSIFDNLTNSVKQHKDPSEIGKIVTEINQELSKSYKGPYTIYASNIKNLSSSDYISKIRSLLDQVISTYASNDTIKAKELATSAYLDNFEYLEKPIGKNLAHEGEELMRVQLRGQIDNKVPMDEIKQTINDINKVLDKAENSLKS